jgi:ABC-type uncharacterized transport system permease subunit
MIGFGAFSLFTIGVNSYYGATASIGTWFSQNAAIIPMAIAAFVAGFVPDRRVQAGALAIVLAMWGWYYWSLQGALSG